MPEVSQDNVDKVERFVKADNLDIENTNEAMNEDEADRFAGDMVKAYQRPGSMESRAIVSAVEQVAGESGLPVDTVRALAERRVNMKEENGTLSEASYYSKPLDARAREMTMILEEAKQALPPAEFEDYCKMMAPIIMKYKKNMPAEYVNRVSANMDPQDMAVIDAQFDPNVTPEQLRKQVMEGALGRNREKSAEHIAKWFSVEWPRYTEDKDVKGALTDYARFITNTYALEFGMYNDVKTLVYKDFSGLFRDALKTAKQSYPNNPDGARNSIKLSLKNSFESYYDKHYRS